MNKHKQKVEKKKDDRYFGGLKNSPNLNNSLITIHLTYFLPFFTNLLNNLKRKGGWF